MHARACKQYIFRSSSTSAFSAIRFDVNPFSCRCKKEVTENGVKVSNLALLFVVFKRRHSNEGVQNKTLQAVADIADADVQSAAPPLSDCSLTDTLVIVARCAVCLHPLNVRTSSQCRNFQCRVFVCVYVRDRDRDRDTEWVNYSLA